MRRSLLFALLILVGSSSPAGAATWYVDQSAAAGGDGSQAKPFRKINDVKAVLKTGDTVLIGNGTYQESVDFFHVPAGTGGTTTIQAGPGASPVIDGGGASFVFQAGETPNMVFKGLTVRNAEEGFSFYTGTVGGTPNANGGQVINCVTQNISGAAIEFYLTNNVLVEGCDLQGSVAGKKVDGAVIKNSKIHNASAEGITLHADSKNGKYLNNYVYDNYHVNIYLDSCSSMIVDGNVVYETGTPPDDQSGILLADEAYPSLGVTSPKLNNIRITNNVINNNYSGIEFWDGAFAGQSALKNVTIANNSIVNSRVLGLVWAPGPHSGTVIRNNIIANKTGGTFLLNAKSTSGVTLDHNLWFAPTISEPLNWGGGTAYDHASWVAATGQGAGDVLADPGFAGGWALPAANLALAAGSPAIDKGVVIAGLVTDFAGNARPAGPAYDLGAFEYGAVGFDGGPPEPKLDGGIGPTTEKGLPITTDGAPPAGDGQAPGGDGSATTYGSRPDSSGCSCAVAGASSPGGWLLAALALALLAISRRRFAR